MKIIPSTTHIVSIHTVDTNLEIEHDERTLTVSSESDFDDEIEIAVTSDERSAYFYVPREDIPAFLQALNSHLSRFVD